MRSGRIPLSSTEKASGTVTYSPHLEEAAKAAVSKDGQVASSFETPRFAGSSG
jgi:hypothetical protein